MFTLTPQHEKLLDAAEAIRLDPDKIEAAFMARQLVQATLPHSDPKDVPLWTRTNGNLTLAIQAGMNIKTRKSYGYPYGTIPRLLLFWMTTEAVRTKSPRLELGNSLNDFMNKIGLNQITGRGKRGDATRLKNQMDRLFNALISFETTIEEEKSTKESRINMTVATKTTYWWSKNPNQETLFESSVELSKDFFEAITAAPVPVDMRALKALKRSPLALDLYAWASYTAYQTQRKQQSRFVSWELLHEQMGAEYNRLDNFQAAAKAAMRKVQAVYPTLGIDYEKGGVRVLPSKPAVTIKAKTIKKPASTAL
jgi:hypothetical protein